MAEQTRLPDELSELLSLELHEDEPGAARPLSGAEERDLIEGVLDQWTPSPAVSPARRPRGARLWGWALAALALCVGSAAALYVAQQRQATTPAGGPPPAKPPAVAPPVADEPEPPVEAELREAEADLEQTPDQAAPRRAKRSPQDLLARGNRLRGEGRYAEAERTYMQVVRSAPRSGSAHVARIAAADLRLEQLDDPAGALSLYRGARTSQGPLALEARAGTARALRRLGRLDEERKALEQLLQHHPEGAAAERARKRLDALRTRRP